MSVETASADPIATISEPGQQPRSITVPTQINSYSAKVGELFLIAGNAFEKLGEITLQLNSTNIDPSENRWTEHEIDSLKNAIVRFADDLENVSESLLSRTKLMIRKDIKRRTLQMGEMTGGATMSTASRTTFKPVNTADVRVKLEPASLGNDDSPTTMMADSNTDGTSSDIHIIAATSQESISHERPPLLTPEPAKPDQQHSAQNPTIIKRYAPGSAPQVTIRRGQVTVPNRPVGQVSRSFSCMQIPILLLSPSAW